MSHKTAKAMRALPAVIALSNADRMPVASGNDLRPGEIYALSNDSRFTETNFSEKLTTFATGFKDPNKIEEALEFFAPEVVVPGRLFEFKKFNNAEEFFSETDDIRAIGADFKRVEYTGSDATAKTLNKGLTMRIDLDNVPQVAGWENRYVAKLMRRIYRNELRRAIGLLSAAATNTAKTWDTSADPDQDVIAELITSADAVGFAPNRIGFGHTAWSKRSLALRGNNNSAKFATAGFNESQLAGLLNVDEVLVSKERYQSSASAKSQVVGNLVLMFTALAGQDTEDASNIKRFVSAPPNVLTGGSAYQRPSGGLNVNVYLQQVSAKLVDITVEHYSTLVMTSTLGVRQFTVS